MEQIEVGASDADGTLSYWRAKEAIRQGEARLTAQSGVRSMMEARATVITGWAAAGLAVTAGALFARRTAGPGFPWR